MADQTVTLNIKAVNQASAEMAKIAADVTKLERSTRAYGTATGPAKAAAAQFYDTLKAGRGVTDGAASGLGGMNKAAKDLAQGGMRDLAGSVPVVGGALTNLVGTLKGFPLALAGVAAAGVGLIAFLKNLEEQAAKTAAGIATMSTGIGADFQATVAKINAIRASSRGDLGRAAAEDFRATEIEARAAEQRAIEAAQAQRGSAIGVVDRAQGLLNPQALRDKLTLADAEYQTARAKAEVDANTTITKAREQLKADLLKIEADLDTKSAESQEKRVKDAAEAAEKQTRLIRDLTVKSRSIVEGLGSGFADLAKKLGVGQFVQETQDALGVLRQSFEQGVISQQDLTRGTEVLTEKMQEAVRLGYVPAIEKTQELAAETAKAADVAEDAGAKWLTSISGISASLDALIAKSRAAASAVAGAGSGATGVSGLDTTVLGPIANQSPGSGLRPFNPDFDLPHFAAGGVVPGPTGQPRVIVAHGGEEVTPAGKRGGGSRTTVNHITVNVSGTVIQQERDWAVLVEHLGQSLDDRSGRLYGR